MKFNLYSSRVDYTFQLLKSSKVVYVGQLDFVLSFRLKRRNHLNFNLQLLFGTKTRAR